MLCERIIDRPVLAGGKPFLIAGIKIIAVPPEVGKAGKPFLADKPGLTAKKLSVNALPAAGSRPFPFPRAVRIFREPKLRRTTILHGKTGDLARKER